MDRKMYSKHIDSKHVWVTVATVTSGIKSNLQQRSFCIFFVAKGKKKDTFGESLYLYTVKESQEMTNQH